MALIPCISLHQPHASFLARGLKPYETRNRPWGPSLIGCPIGIHAAAREPAARAWDDVRADLEAWLRKPIADPVGLRLQQALELIKPFDRKGAPDNMPYGCLVGLFEFGKPVPGEQIEGEPFGTFGRGRWAMPVVKIVEVFAEPIPLKGKQSWFYWDRDA